jgi:DNA repair exonuclease SbcCD ATPase subunit
MALKIKSLKAKNFRCFKDLFLTLPEEGLYYLEGKNLDASYTEFNGVGKTSLLDLPSVILFGRGVRDSEKKKLVFKDYLRHKCKEAELVMELTDTDGPEYVITRIITRLRTNLSIQYGNEVLHDQFAKDFIEEKLGLTFNSFTSTCLFGQGKFNVFLTSTETEKVSLLEELFKLTLLDEIKKRITDRKDDLKDSWETAKKEEFRTFAEKSSADARYEAFKEMYTKERSEAERFILNNSNSNVYARLDDCLVASKRKTSNLTDLDREITAAETMLNSSTWGQLRNGLEPGKPCPLCRRVVELDLESSEWIERQNKKHQDYVSIQNRLAELKNLRMKLTDEIQKLDIHTLELTQEKETLERELDKAKKLLALSESVIEEADNARFEASEKWMAATNKLAKIEQEREKLESLGKLLGSAELRSKIVGNYLELINYYSKKYISFLTNGELSVKFDFVKDLNKITVDVIDTKNNYTVSYFGYSGGERRRLDFGVFLAFNQVNRHILKNPMQVLFLDETFDQLDQMGIDKCIELLKYEKDNLGMVLVTGHTEAMGSLFNNKISLVKKGSVTTLA